MGFLLLFLDGVAEILLNFIGFHEQTTAEKYILGRALLKNKYNSEATVIQYSDI